MLKQAPSDAAKNPKPSACQILDERTPPLLPVPFLPGPERPPNDPPAMVHTAPEARPPEDRLLLAQSILLCPFA